MRAPGGRVELQGFAGGERFEMFHVKTNREQNRVFPPFSLLSAPAPGARKTAWKNPDACVKSLLFAPRNDWTSLFGAAIVRRDMLPAQNLDFSR
jgi:hypothetical protein